MRLIALILALGFLVFGNAYAQEGQFVGELVLKDIDPDGRNFELVEPFGYIDPKGVRWQVPPLA
jgi:hypothetical protein